jgi:hypothetical protein
VGFTDTHPLAETTGAQLLRATALAGDAFGRARVSTPVLELDAKFTSDLHPLEFNAPVTAGGTVAKTAGTTRAELAVTAAGDAAALTLRYPLLYRAAQSQLVAMTGAFAPREAALEQRIGYGDATDGIRLVDTGAGLTLLITDSYSGVPESVAQSAWNVDPMDGTGPSGYTLDPENGFIFVIDMQYLGVGRVRCGFYDETGCLCWAHEFDHVGTATAPYMRTANLRPTWEIVAGGAYAGAGATMFAICVGAVREGAAEEPGKAFAVSRGQSAALASTDTLATALSVRLKSAYALDHTIRPLDVSVACSDTDPLRWVLLKQTHADAPAGVTGGAWTSVADGSAAEYSVVNANVVPTVRDAVYDSGVLVSTAQSRGALRAAIERCLPLGTDAAGASDVLMLCLQSQKAGSASAGYFDMRFEEFE